MPIPLHDSVFQFLENYRKAHPDFVYWLRERDTRNRLTEGYWFQGNDDYVWVGLYDRSGGSNMTRSIGLVFTPSDVGMGCHFEVVFNEEKDPSMLQFYQNLMDTLKGFDRVSDTRFQKSLTKTDGFAIAEQFLDTVKPEIDKMIINARLNHLFIDLADFLKKVERIKHLQMETEKTLISAEKASEIKKRFESFKGTEFDLRRRQQLQFVPFAQKVILNMLKGDLSNELLSAIIQITNNKITAPTVHRYLEQSFDDESLVKELISEFDELTLPGFTTASRGSIKNLDAEDLSIVKTFLQKAHAVQNINDAIKVVEDFEAQDTWMVKKGIYSPWIYYLNPHVFPIQNNAIRPFMKWCGQKRDNYGLTMRVYEELSKITGETDRGILDAFTNTFESGSGSASSKDEELVIPVYFPNTILYGPPGTGKTYQTIEKAIRIANPEYVFEGKNREEIKEEFSRLKSAGQVEFCTFHQNMSYEDFIEGIKPDNSGDQSFLKYNIQDGIFKEICINAAYRPDTQTKFFKVSAEDFDASSFYKISLGNTDLSDDDDIYRYCMDNNCIAMGWGEDIDFTKNSVSEVNEKAKQLNRGPFSGRAINMFMHAIKEGDFVLVSNGNHECRAIGRVTGDYYYVQDPDIRYHQFRPVKWLLKDVTVPVREIYNRNFSQQTIYQMYKKELKSDFFIKGRKNGDEETVRNYVLIIDEINRGNVSRIFGELITLIEKDKRHGAKEALETILPYSKKSFSVPSNLYIIGTMNTADRSVEALDTALRRRFAFEEIEPKSYLLHPRKLLVDYWNDPEILRNQNWYEEPLWTEANNFYDLLGFNREMEERVMTDSAHVDREYYLTEDFEVIAEDEFESGVRLDLVLEAINNRIEVLLSKDQQIGHAFFIHCKSQEDLYFAFYEKLIPQLQEYFYGNFGKIGLVLGKKFIKEKTSKIKFADFEFDDTELLENRKVFRMNNFIEDNAVVYESFIESVKSIYEGH